MLRQSEWPFGWEAGSSSPGRTGPHLSSRKRALTTPDPRDRHLGALLAQLFPRESESRGEVPGAGAQTRLPFPMGEDSMLGSQTSGPGGVLPRLQSQEASLGALGREG